MGFHKTDPQVTHAIRANQTHSYSANFKQLSLLFHRCGLPLELLSLQSCPQDSMLTFFFFSDTCWGTLSPSLHSGILKFSSSHTKQKINILDSQLEPRAIVLQRCNMSRLYVPSLTYWIVTENRPQGHLPVTLGYDQQNQASILAVFSVFKTSSERRQALHPTWNNPSPQLN